MAPKAEFVRLVAAGGEVVVDAEQRLPGRGAYLCRSAGCWELAMRRKAFARAFRQPVTVPGDALNLSA